MTYVEEIMEQVVKNNPGQPEFHQRSADPSGDRYRVFHIDGDYRRPCSAGTICGACRSCKFYDKERLI